RGERGRDLAADVARLAHAGNDHASAGAADQVDRRGEPFAQAVVNRCRERVDAAGLGFERADRRGDQVPEIMLTSGEGLGHEAAVTRCGRTLDSTGSAGPRLLRRATARKPYPFNSVNQRPLGRPHASSWWARRGPLNRVQRFDPEQHFSVAPRGRSLRGGSRGAGTQGYRGAEPSPTTSGSNARRV